MSNPQHKKLTYERINSEPELALVKTNEVALMWCKNRPSESPWFCGGLTCSPWNFLVKLTSGSKPVKLNLCILLLYDILIKSYKRIDCLARQNQICILIKICILRIHPVT